MSTDSASNPQIAVITHMEKKIIDSLDDAECLKSLRQIYTLHTLMREKHRKTDFLKKIKEEYTLLANTRNPDKFKTHCENNMFKYIDWYGETMEILYDKNYLTDSGYSFYDPSGDRPSP